MGNECRDQNHDYAFFEATTSSPASMEAGKALDAYGCVEGNDIQQADAIQAYIHADLGGVETWVRLPREQWPKSWNGMEDPVCSLLKALYGHPRAGADWEHFSQQHIISQGFELVADEWKSVYWHPKLRLMLVVYVDDFRMAGPKENLLEGWNLIKKNIRLDPPEPCGKYLGCIHKKGKAVLDPDGKLVLEPRVGSPDSADYTSKKAGDSVQGGTVVNCVEYDMKSYMEKGVSNYTKLAGKDGARLKTVSTPFIDETKTDPDSGREGHLKPLASRVLMQILYGARLARFDLLRPVNGLAQYVSKWNKTCDKKIHRLVSYVNSSTDLRMIGYIGDPLDDLSLGLYADADLASCPDTMKSTNGALLVLQGPNSFFPLAALSKKQTVTSTSSTEAEIVSLFYALKNEGIPALSLWEKILGRTPTLYVYEDNQSCIKVANTGRSDALRHTSRTHKIDIS